MGNDKKKRPPLAGSPDEIREEIVRSLVAYAGGKGITKKQLEAVSGALLPFFIPAAEAAAQQAALMVLTTDRKQPKDTYKDTERRLYALPTLRSSLRHKGQQLLYLQGGDIPGKSNSVVRFQKNGVRLDKDDIIDAMAQNLISEIAGIQYEIETIEEALKTIEDDKYYLAVYGKYIDGLSDDEIAEEIPCDPSTVRRHRGQLVRKLAIWLYGVSAI